MRLWTIQNENAYAELMNTGELTANEQHLFCQDDFRYAYDWMAKKLSERVPAPAGVRYPIWAWYQWEGKRGRRDLRSGGLAVRGEKCVQLELEIPDEQILLSDFDVFHMVLNYAYIAVDEADDNLFDAWSAALGVSRDEIRSAASVSSSVLTVRDRIIKSWDGVFDLTKEDDNWMYGKNENKSIQAVFWEIWAKQVVKAEFFTAR